MLRTLDEHGVAFRAVDQPELDTTTSLGKAIFGIAAIFAELERSILRERVKAGMANAREKGVRIGRPSVLEDPTFRRAWPQVRNHVVAGTMSRRKAAKRLGIGQATLKRLLDSDGSLRRTRRTPGEDPSPMHQNGGVPGSDRMAM